jgi:hypothetical protein
LASGERLFHARMEFAGDLSILALSTLVGELDARAMRATKVKTLTIGDNPESRIRTISMKPKAA